MSAHLSALQVKQRASRTAWFWRGLMALVAVGLVSTYYNVFDYYEIAIVAITAVGMSFVGQSWPEFRWHSVIVAAVSLVAISIYGQELQTAEQNFWLNYLLSSQSAFMWMSALFVMATIAYFIGNLSHSEFVEHVATFLTWSATTMGMIGLMVRWRESYLMGGGMGHIPVSNLYEVFILFSIVTAFLYLFYERRYQTRSLGGFVLLVISAAVAFQLWYSFDRQADQIQPLVPALQSYWMKIHVPANFIGYGAFSIAAMIGVAYLIVVWRQQKNPTSTWVKTMPSLNVMDDLMYKTIALGFAFFTLATILGALWAAEAWGGYWSWDPKETWALIVWLNYAAWLHMRLTKGWHGKPMAWWAIVGLFVTLFAFLGVNMFLSGLHSYGEL
ncbi:MAG TPA: c-type cytochrome biogenesis protein CcsB [Methylophaga aminisulfidivorans]|uniref:C-type cytochrome biogenesis protein CcsB n=2 Tax=root TaxID=1 RepID=A0A7C2A8M6_9GAMM|nr:c-type cytochrome biogenesis protein CcsB [Methylophaga aminisulfidivorans]